MYSPLPQHLVPVARDSTTGAGGAAAAVAALSPLLLLLLLLVVVVVMVVAFASVSVSTSTATTAASTLNSPLAALGFPLQGGAGWGEARWRLVLAACIHTPTHHAQDTLCHAVPCTSNVTYLSGKRE